MPLRPIALVSVIQINLEIMVPTDMESSYIPVYNARFLWVINLAKAGIKQHKRGFQQRNYAEKVRLTEHGVCSG